MGIKQDLQTLEDYYKRPSNDIVIVYSNGLSNLDGVLSEFLKDKEYFKYVSKSCDSNLQLSFLKHDLYEQIKKNSFVSDDLGEMIRTFAESSDNKVVFVLEGMLHFLKEDKTFINFLSVIRSRMVGKSRILILLTSLDQSFVENSMVDFLKQSSYEIDAVLKIGSSDFAQLKERYNNVNLADLLSIYLSVGSCFAGLSTIANESSYKSYICNNLLGINKPLFLLGKNILPDSLRIHTVYNTILYYLANGVNKLNDLYARTGYERAKISVYLKNLSAYGMVRKGDKIPGICEKYQKKGTYYIDEPFVLFWYRFIFPNISRIDTLPPERFYRKYIEPGLFSFLEETYPIVCLEEMSQYANKETSVIQWYYDKDEAIDFITGEDNGKICVCACRYKSPHMSFGRLESVLSSCHKAGIEPYQIHLFSASGFDQKLSMYSHIHDEVILHEHIDQRMK